MSKFSLEFHNFKWKIKVSCLLEVVKVFHKTLQIKYLTNFRFDWEGEGVTVRYVKGGGLVQRFVTVHYYLNRIKHELVLYIYIYTSIKA